MKNAIIEMEFNVPKEEYDSISIMIVNVGRAVLQEVTKERAQVQMPPTSTQIISYAYRELIVLERTEYNRGKPFEKIKLPVWLTTNTGVAMEHCKITMSKKRYLEMINSVKTIYPDVYNNSEIKNEDFIAAAGIAWAHRYVSGEFNIIVDERSGIAK